MAGALSLGAPAAPLAVSAAAVPVTGGSVLAIFSGSDLAAAGPLTVGAAPAQEWTALTRFRRPGDGMHGPNNGTRESNPCSVGDVVRGGRSHRYKGR